MHVCEHTLTRNQLVNHHKTYTLYDDKLRFSVLVDCYVCRAYECSKLYRLFILVDEKSVKIVIYSTA